MMILSCGVYSRRMGNTAMQHIAVWRRQRQTQNVGTRAEAKAVEMNCGRR